MTYLIEYLNGNGYGCSCCRRTWVSTETMEFENDAEAKAYVENYNKNYDRYDDAHDSQIVACYPLAGNSLI